MKYSTRYKVARVLKKTGVNFDASKCPEVLNMKEVIAALSGGSIQFVVSREANGDWMAEKKIFKEFCLAALLLMMLKR